MCIISRHVLPNDTVMTSDRRNSSHGVILPWWVHWVRFWNQPKHYQKSTYTLSVVQNSSNAAQNPTFNLLKDAKANGPIRELFDTDKIVFGHFKRLFSANYDPFLFFRRIWLAPSALSCDYGIGQGEPAHFARIFGPNHKLFRNFWIF